MKFIVLKTSTGGHSPDQPCPKAILDEDHDLWSIDLHSISELLKVAKSNESFNPGEIVVTYGCSIPGCVGYIEIYDDRREG